MIMILMVILAVAIVVIMYLLKNNEELKQRLIDYKNKLKIGRRESS